MRDGLGFRNSYFFKVAKQFNWDFGSKQNCINKYGDEYAQYCLIKDTTKDPITIIIGDSNANHLYPGLMKTLGNENILNIGRGACPPFLGIDVSIAENSSQCAKFMEKTIVLLKEEKINTIIISMMGAGYVTNKRSLNGGFLTLKSLENPESTDFGIIFETAMRKTLENITDKNKNIIFVISTPRLDFNPISCVNIRPLRLSPHKPRTPCAITKELFVTSNEQYRNIVFSVLKDFPSVKIFDAAAELCDDKWCWAMKDGNMLYRDDVHLSVQGSEYIARTLSKLIDPAHK